MKRAIGVMGMAVLASGLAVAVPGVARAQGSDHPQLMPTRDATVDYTVTQDGSAQSQTVRVYFAADGGRLRVDGPGGVTTTILDRTAQQVTVILNHNHVYAQFNPQNGLQNPFLLDLSMAFARRDQSTVAGLACTRWDVQAKQGKATTCVTDDGVILEEQGVDADGINGHLVAKTVTYGPIASTEFAPPAGYMKVSHGRPGAAPGVSPNAPASAGGDAPVPQPLAAGKH